MGKVKRGYLPPRSSRFRPKNMITHEKSRKNGGKTKTITDRKKVLGGGTRKSFRGY